MRTFVGQRLTPVKMVAVVAHPLRVVLLVSVGASSNLLFLTSSDRLGLTDASILCLFSPISSSLALGLPLLLLLFLEFFVDLHLVLIVHKFKLLSLAHWSWGFFRSLLRWPLLTNQTWTGLNRFFFRLNNCFFLGFPRSEIPKAAVGLLRGLLGVNTIFGLIGIEISICWRWDQSSMQWLHTTMCHIRHRYLFVSIEFILCININIYV